MKQGFAIKTLSIFLISAICSQSNVTTQITKRYQSYYYKNFDVVSDAVDSISKQLQKENCSPYFIRKTYNIKKGLISVTTKTYYGKYRAKPKFEKKDIHINTSYINTNDTIKFVYKNSDKDHITQICKGSKKINNPNAKFALNNSSKTKSRKVYNT